MQRSLLKISSMSAAPALPPSLPSDSPSRSIWSLSSLLVIAIIIRTWKERNKSYTIAKEKPWSPSICICHLQPLGAWTCYHGAFWLDGTERKKKKKKPWHSAAQNKQALLPPPSFPSGFQSLSHPVGDTRGQSTLLLVIVWAGGIQQEMEQARSSMASTFKSLITDIDFFFFK